MSVAFLRPPAAGDISNPVTDPVEDSNNDYSESTGVNLEDAYAFMCGQAMPDNHASLLSPPIPSPAVGDVSSLDNGPEGQDVVVSKEGVSGSQTPSGDVVSISRSVPYSMDQSSPPASEESILCLLIRKLSAHVRYSFRFLSSLFYFFHSFILPKDYGIVQV